MGPSASQATGGGSRIERRRLERERRFVDAARRIVTAEGFEALTLQRLADELDLVVSALYRYFPSKGALIRQVEIEAIRTLSRSLAEVRLRAERRFAELGLAPKESALASLVLVGRWFCSSAATHREDMRLLQMIMAQRTSELDADGGEMVLPVAFALVEQVVEVIDAASAAGVIGAADALDRAVIWAGALSGVLQTDDLERYAPDRFGGGRLGRQANLDLLRGWGAEPDALERAGAFVDDLAADGPLAP